MLREDYYTEKMASFTIGLIFVFFTIAAANTSPGPPGSQGAGVLKFFSQDFEENENNFAIFTWNRNGSNLSVVLLMYLFFQIQCTTM